MRDLAIVVILFGLIGLGFARPWLMTFAYLYADLMQPQRLSYYAGEVSVSLILAILAVIMFLADKHKNPRFGFMQGLLIVFIGWFTFTSYNAIIQDQTVWQKWDPSWKSVLFGGVFLPLVLSTRRRIESTIVLTTLAVSLVAVGGGLKTAMGGGGYGELRLIVDVNKGIYESSTISTLAVATIPFILYLYAHSPLVGRTRWMRALALFLVACDLLIVVGTAARTGLVCAFIMAFMLFWRARRKLAIGAAAIAVGIAALPLLPASYTDRMKTILAPSEDVSASTRTEMWKWTWHFAQKHPLGGGFRAYRLARVNVRVPRFSDQRTIIGYRDVPEIARAYHSSYFELLGDQGFPGLAMYLTVILGTLLNLHALRRRFQNAAPEDVWIRELARALFRTIAVYAIGGLFVGLGFQTTLYMLVGISVAFGQLVRGRRAVTAAGGPAIPAWRARALRARPVGGADGQGALPA